jgi:hypothetical protein
LSKKAKLIAKLLSRHKDFTFEELATLLNFLGFRQSNAGKTSGSRVAFSNDANDYIRLHKPHPGNELKSYQVDEIITILEERGYI